MVTSASALHQGRRKTKAINSIRALASRSFHYHQGEWYRLQKAVGKSSAGTHVGYELRHVRTGYEWYLYDVPKAIAALPRMAALVAERETKRNSKWDLSVSAIKASVSPRVPKVGI